MRGVDDMTFTNQLVADIAYQELEKHLSDLPDEVQSRVYGIMVIAIWKVIETAEARGAESTQTKGAKDTAAEGAPKAPT